MLDIIQYMKSTGISLKEIGRQLENQGLGGISRPAGKQRQTEEKYAF